MKKFFNILLYFFSLTFITTDLAFAQSYDIKIHNRIEHPPYAAHTNIDAGPEIGGILNAHYFPGLIDYQKGNYVGAKKQIDYFLARPHYTEMNPRQPEFFSHGHYIRGVIYMYHASGPGRFILAKRDFEQSIRWNPKNYASHIQLSHVLSIVGLKEKAISILKNLLELNINEDFIKLINREIDRLQY